MLEPWMHSLLDGVTASVVGIIAATTIKEIQQGLIFALALVLVVYWKSKASTPVRMRVGALIRSAVAG